MNNIKLKKIISSKDWINYGFYCHKRKLKHHLEDEDLEIDSYFILDKYDTIIGVVVMAENYNHSNEIIKLLHIDNEFKNKGVIKLVINELIHIYGKIEIKWRFTKYYEY